jgi:uracil-DNA glycosylase
MYYRIPDFNSKCTKCLLGSGSGVIGQSKVPFDQVKLIVVSGTPTGREEKTGVALCGNENRKGVPDSNKSSVGAGEYLRYCLEVFFDKDKTFTEEYKPIENWVYFTHALKCSPQRGRDKITVVAKHIKTCKETYLSSELDMFNSRVPILAAGTEATKALLGIDKSLSNNPTDWEKYSAKYVPDLEVARGYVVKLMKNGQLKKFKKSIDKVIGAKVWKALPGSPLYFVKQDLEAIKKEVVAYINEQQQ